MHRAVHPRSARLPLLVLTLVIALGAAMCIRVHHAAARPSASARSAAAARGAATAAAPVRGAERVRR